MSEVVNEEKLENDPKLASAYRELVRAAATAAKNAYAPYSNKPQGAAVLTESGEIISGATVEISTYSHSCSAEINALTQAIALGHRRFKAIAIEPYANPSGVSRQFIAEFGIDVDIVYSTAGGIKILPLRELLPFHFGPANLEAHEKAVGATGGGAA